MLSLNAQVRTVQIEQARHDLSLLLSDVHAVAAAVASPPISPVSPTSTPTPAAAPVVPAGPRARLARLTSLAARLARGRRRYVPLDERGLLRRGSADSDVTLAAGPAAPGCAESGGDLGDGPTTALLGQLAPLVAGLQGATPRVSSLAEPRLREPHARVCDALRALLDDLRIDGAKQGYAAEMRGMMLDALARKVEAERAAVSRLTAPSPVSSGPPSPMSTTSASNASRASNASHAPNASRVSAPPMSPFAAPPTNPFILHSAALLHPPHRPSIAKAIPVPARAASPASGTTLGAPPSYHSFMGQSQLTARAWHAGDVVRLCSFQASALFSPSPIAVRRVVGPPGA